MSDSVQPVLIVQGLGFAEGINFDREGRLFCVDITGGTVCKKEPEGDLDVWVRTGGAPNGSRFGPGGDLFIADCGLGSILRISPAAEVSVYADRWNGQPFRGPNDLCFGPDGTLFFTDPQDSSLDARIGSVYAVTTEREVRQVATGLAFPNGLMVTPDGERLVVAETHTGILHQYSLMQDSLYSELAMLGRLEPARQGDDEAGPDGIAYGADGNLYVAHYGSGLIRVVAASGEVVRDLAAGGAHPTNVAFWQESLYVTEGTTGSIYRLDIGVRENPFFSRPW